MTDIKLKVPYYTQVDNRSQAMRTCNSSTHAMLLNYLKPGSVKSDDDYWKKFVQPYGDSTDHNVHTQALREHGIESLWRTDLDFEHINRSLNVKIPVAIGVAHRGNVYTPIGGHIILVVGRKDGGNARSINDDVYYVHDPLGAGFEYTSVTLGKGAYQEYPVIPSLVNRWQVEGARSGWGRVITAIDGKPTGLK